jgi:hypothetical protein|tara:strand:+ start:214 stop:333 length:120 start_codon:yes stop_codon:yes gene_type:complete
MKYLAILFFAAITLSSCTKDEPTPCEQGGDPALQEQQNS